MSVNMNTEMTAAGSTLQAASGAKDDRDTILEVRNLVKYFPIRSSFFKRTIGNVKAVDGVSFPLRESRPWAW